MERRWSSPFRYCVTILVASGQSCFAPHHADSQKYSGIILLARGVARFPSLLAGEGEGQCRLPN